MPLPTAPEVNAIARNLGSALGGLILAFGLSSKIAPNAVASLAVQLGNVVNDIIVVIGLVVPLVAAYFARASATPAAQAQSVGETGALVITTPAIAAATPSNNVIAANTVKVTPIPTPASK